MNHMWADTLMSAERYHLLRLAILGMTSVLAGTAVFATARRSGRRSSLLDQFALQMTGWGIVELAWAASSMTRLAPRDLAAATRLDRLLWFEVGLSAGLVLVGVTLVMTGWRLARRQAVMGAGAGLVVQGVALLVLHLVLASVVSR